MRAFSKISVYAAIAAALCASGCATTATQRTSALRSDAFDASDEPPRSGRRSDVVSRADLRDGSAPTLAVALRRLRPEYFRTTVVPQLGGGPATFVPSVYLNGAYAGGTETLETIPLDAVEEVRYIRPTLAREWWGTRCPCDGGVIFVRARLSRS